jgi:hypothetical protein
MALHAIGDLLEAWGVPFRTLNFFDKLMFPEPGIVLNAKVRCLFPYFSHSHFGFTSIGFENMAFLPERFI